MKKDCEYFPASTINITRLDNIQEGKKEKVWVDNSQAIDLDSLNIGANQFTPTAIVLTPHSLSTTSPSLVFFVDPTTQPLKPIISSP